MRWPGLISLAALLMGGCLPDNNELVTPQRMESGLVMILPGIEGDGPFSAEVRRGLDESGLGCALPIIRWGRPVPIAGPLLNQMDLIGNRLAAQRLADAIVNYQDSHPGRPVHLVGHSGGGGVSIFTAEALPQGRKVDGIVLLSASISAGYDLTKALAHSRKGIVNFYSKNDVGLLMIGTTVVGNVDGIHGPAAGAIGFDRLPEGLHQVPWSQDMSWAGSGGHMDTTGAPFVRTFVSPWIRAPAWPAR